MDRESPKFERAASPTVRWAAAVAVAAAIALYVALHGRVIATAVVRTLEALRG